LEEPIYEYRGWWEATDKQKYGYNKQGFLCKVLIKWDEVTK
jgi:hypothetical protein